MESRVITFEGMNMLKEAIKQDPIASSRMAGFRQQRNLPQESLDNQLLQTFIRTSMQRDSTTVNEMGTGLPNRPSAGQDSSFNYIFNMLLSSVSNQDGGNVTASESMINLNQSFGNSGSNQDMNDN